MPRVPDRSREFFTFGKGIPATTSTPVVKPRWKCNNCSDDGVACEYTIIGAAFKAPLARAHLAGSAQHLGGYLAAKHVCKCGSSESMKYFQRKIEEKAQKVSDDSCRSCRGAGIDCFRSSSCSSSGSEIRPAGE